MQVAFPWIVLLSCLGSVLWRFWNGFELLAQRSAPRLNPLETSKSLLWKLMNFGIFYKKKKNKLWIFKAYDRHRQRLIDGEIGDRSHQTFKRLHETLKKFNPLFYCSDHWIQFFEICNIWCFDSPKHNCVIGLKKWYSFNFVIALSRGRTLF